jgi:hypothetical protein
VAVVLFLCFPFGCSRSSFWILFFVGEEDGVWVVWKNEVDVADLYYCSSFSLDAGSSLFSGVFLISM